MPRRRARYSLLVGGTLLVYAMVTIQPSYAGARDETTAFTAPATTRLAASAPRAATSSANDDAVQPCNAQSLQAAVSCVEPSVLRVVVKLSAKSFAEGSSFVIRSDDTGTYLLTNRHVVEGATLKGTIVVAPDEKKDYQPLAILANNGKPGTAGDLAIVRLKPHLGLRPLAFGNSDTLAPGQTVSSIGYGIGLQGPPSVTEGIISAVHRDLDDGSGPVWIQHQSTINHGNSGGPLITLQGDIVGVNTLSITQLPNGDNGVQGLFFAIPANAASKVALRLITKIEGPAALARPPAPAPPAGPFQGPGYTVTLPPGWFVGHLTNGSPRLESRDQQVQVDAKVIKGNGILVTRDKLLSTLKGVIQSTAKNATNVTYDTTITYTGKNNAVGLGVEATITYPSGSHALVLLAEDSTANHFYIVDALVQANAPQADVQQLDVILKSFTGTE